MSLKEALEGDSELRLDDDNISLSEKLLISVKLKLL